jgi:hypothetical protein
MNKFISLIETTSKKPLLFILIGALVVFNIVMNTPGLPTSTPSMQELSPTFTPFDLQAKGYTAESFTSDLNNLGEAGRSIYRNFMLCDIFFPAVYGLTFASLIFLVLGKRRDLLKWLFLIPLCTAAADYVENIFIAISFSGFPTPNAVAVSLASAATQAKMLFNVLLVLALLITIGFWVSGLIRKK